ncbi:MAG: M48 family metalloprotease, partial [Pyrinomonadaceae bacterium]|nr:M48 family metalloprotease [Phycisphaerales bacterium]
MLHLWVIALFMSIIWRDMAGRPLAGHLLAPGEVTWVVLAPMLAISLAMWTVATRCARRIDATGSPHAIRMAETALSVSRWAAVIVFAAGVIVLGWLDVVRGVTGDLVIVDELLAMSPALAVFIVGWWSVYPIDQRLREATIFRSLHAGEPEQSFYPGPTRSQFVLMHVRHQLLLTLAPLVLIGIWTETSHWLLHHVHSWARGPAGDAHQGSLIAGLATRLARNENMAIIAMTMQLLGVLTVFILAPLVLRFVWNTSVLPPGELRDRLLIMCRTHRIRVRNILIWRTHGTMMNGAVMGLIAPARYILLTDVLIDSMPTAELEAVMAHELAHVRHQHIIWLALSLMVSVGIAAALIGLAISLSGVGSSIISSDVAGLLITALALGVGLCF